MSFSSLTDIKKYLQKNNGFYKIYKVAIDDKNNFKYNLTYNNIGNFLDFPTERLLITLENYERGRTKDYNFKPLIFINGLKLASDDYIIEKNLNGIRFYIKSELIEDNDVLEFIIYKYLKNDKGFSKVISSQNAFKYYEKYSEEGLYNKYYLGKNTKYKEQIIGLKKDADSRFYQTLDKSNLLKSEVTPSMYPTNNIVPKRSFNISRPEFFIEKNGDTNWFISFLGPHEANSTLRFTSLLYKPKNNTILNTSPIAEFVDLNKVFKNSIPLFEKSIGNLWTPKITFYNEKDISVYVDGRKLIYNEHYTLIWNDNRFSNVLPVVMFTLELLENNKIEIEVSDRPFIEETCFELLIPNIHPSGIIDLGELNIPIQKEYLDVYISGRKISHDDIELIEDEIIKINNLKTTKHVYIKVLLEYNDTILECFDFYNDNKSINMQNIRNTGYENWLNQYISDNSIELIENDEDEEFSMFQNIYSDFIEYNLPKLSQEIITDFTFNSELGKEQNRNSSYFLLGSSQLGINKFAWYKFNYSENDYFSTSFHDLEDFQEILADDHIVSSSNLGKENKVLLSTEISNNINIEIFNGSDSRTLNSFILGRNSSLLGGNLPLFTNNFFNNKLDILKNMASSILQLETTPINLKQEDFIANLNFILSADPAKRIQESFFKIDMLQNVTWLDYIKNDIVNSIDTSQYIYSDNLTENFRYTHIFDIFYNSDSLLFSENLLYPYAKLIEYIPLLETNSINIDNINKVGEVSNYFDSTFQTTEQNKNSSYFLLGSSQLGIGKFAWYRFNYSENDYFSTSFHDLEDFQEILADDYINLSNDLGKENKVLLSSEISNNINIDIFNGSDNRTLNSFILGESSSLLGGLLPLFKNKCLIIKSELSDTSSLILNSEIPPINLKQESFIANLNFILSADPANKLKESFLKLDMLETEETWEDYIKNDIVNSIDTSQYIYSDNLTENFRYTHIYDVFLNNESLLFSENLLYPYAKLIEYIPLLETNSINIDNINKVGEVSNYFDSTFQTTEQNKNSSYFLLGSSQLGIDSFAWYKFNYSDADYFSTSFRDLEEFQEILADDHIVSSSNLGKENKVLLSSEISNNINIDIFNGSDSEILNSFILGESSSLLGGLLPLFKNKCLIIKSELNDINSDCNIYSDIPSENYNYFKKQIPFTLLNSKLNYDLLYSNLPTETIQSDLNYFDIDPANKLKESFLKLDMSETETWEEYIKNDIVNDINSDCNIYSDIPSENYNYFKKQIPFTLLNSKLNYDLLYSNLPTEIVHSDYKIIEDTKISTLEQQNNLEFFLINNENKLSYLENENIEYNFTFYDYYPISVPANSFILSQSLLNTKLYQISKIHDSLILQS